MSRRAAESSALLLVDSALLRSGVPHDGVREMLQALRAAGLRLGAVADGERASWEAAALRAGLELDAVVEYGPLRETLQRSAEALGVPLDEMTVVGGSEEALRAAQALGMRTGRALWTGPAVAKSAGCSDWDFVRPADVTRTLAAWC